MMTLPPDRMICSCSLAITRGRRFLGSRSSAADSVYHVGSQSDELSTLYCANGMELIAVGRY